MTVTELEVKISNINNVIRWNNAHMLGYEDCIVKCNRYGCYACNELLAEIEGLELNNIELKDTLQFLQTELELAAMPTWFFKYAVSNTGKIADCLVHAMSYQESLDTFTVTHNFSCVLLDVILIAE